jgi:hypothetical protein
MSADQFAHIRRYGGKSVASLELFATEVAPKLRGKEPAGGAGRSGSACLQPISCFRRGRYGAAAPRASRWPPDSTPALPACRLTSERLERIDKSVDHRRRRATRALTANTLHPAWSCRILPARLDSGMVSARGVP